MSVGIGNGHIGLVLVSSGLALIFDSKLRTGVMSCEAYLSASYIKLIAQGRSIVSKNNFGNKLSTF